LGSYERRTPIKATTFLTGTLALSLALLPAALLAADMRTAADPGLTHRETSELLAAYSHLTADYYKAVDRQAVVDGARNNILAYLRANGVANAALPPLHAGTDDADNERMLEHAVTVAVHKYAAVAGGTAGATAGSTNIVYAAISGELGAVKDKYTVFLSPKEYAEINESLDGTDFGGVGLTFDIDDKTKAIHVENVIPDGPADKAGVRNDDLIAQINGKPVSEQLAGKPADAQSKVVQGLLRGPAGTVVNLGIDRSGQMQSIAVTRALIHSPSVLARMLPSGIGWVQLSVFGMDTGHELDAALNRLNAQGAKAFILDLRYNGGGYVNAAIDVSSKFIASGPIVTVQSRAGTDTEYDAENTAIAPRPLAVLVNHYSASASEITAGALEDSGVAKIIGTRTYGKGVVQTVYPLGDGSALKITTARYLTPHGRDINAVGIEPQIVSDIPKDARIRLGDPASDVQLDAAVTYLQSQIAARTTSASQ
jgi:carboxyl-terminal processing protease